MTAVTATISPSVIADALKAARDVGTRTTVEGLPAPIGTWIRGKADEIWEKIEAAIQSAYWFGLDTAVALRDQALALVHSAVAEVQDQAGELQAAVLDQIRTYQRTVVHGALAQVEHSVTVGGSVLELQSVNVGYKFSLGASLQVSITQLIALTGAGELAIEATYGAPA